MPVIRESHTSPDCKMSFLRLLFSVPPLEGEGCEERNRPGRRGKPAASQNLLLCCSPQPTQLGLAICSEGEAKVLVTTRTYNIGGLGLRGASVGKGTCVKV